MVLFQSDYAHWDLFIICSVAAASRTPLPLSADLLMFFFFWIYMFIAAIKMTENGCKWKKEECVLRLDAAATINTTVTATAAATAVAAADAVVFVDKSATDCAS